MKRWISKVIVLVLLLNLCIISPQAAPYVLDNGYGGGKWEFSETPAAGEVVIQNIILGVWPYEDSYEATTEKVYLVPVGTEITVVEPGYYNPMFGGPTPYDGYCVTYRDMQGYRKSSRTEATSTPLKIEQGVIYEIYPAHLSGGPSYLHNFFVMASSTAGTETLPETVAGFSDVFANAYYADAVKWAVEKQITNGTVANKFSPDVTCTTAQILTFLWRANGSPDPTIANPFTDVTSDDYYADAAIWAYEKNLVSGTSFNGDTPCTRSATVTYLWKLAGSPSAATASFDDVDMDAEYAQAVSWAVQEGITNGTGTTTFSPDGICSRGQIVTFLYRDLVQ